MVLSMIEVATAIIVGSLPCMSSTFTRKYVHRNNKQPYPLDNCRGIDVFSNRRTFAEVGAAELSEDILSSTSVLRPWA